jgi:hypothetical protein
VRGEWGIMRLAGAVLWFSVIYVMIYSTDMWGPGYPRIPVPMGKIAILKLAWFERVHLLFIDNH